MENTPKCFEHKRRDSIANTNSEHYCDEFNLNSKIEPSKWRQNYINCRNCKRRLVILFGEFLLSTHLQPHQALYVSGAFPELLEETTWFVKGSHSRQPEPALTANAEETDTRLWLHAARTTHTKILIVSHRTQTYITDIEIIVRLSTLNSRETKYLHMSALLQCLQNDPELSTIPSQLVPRIIQTLYIASGCDYTSFFSQMGKSTFYKHLFHYAPFITSGEVEGTLAESQGTHENGLLSFLRLLGTVYFKKHASGFNTQSPSTHFCRFAGPNISLREQHSLWLQDIRENIWHRIKFENQMIPSDDALHYHWLRTCWVSNTWSQADKNHMVLPPLTDYGWNTHNGSLAIVWDSHSNISEIRERVNILLKGCKCNTGCQTSRCSCRKNKRQCAEGCECTNCRDMGNCSSTNLGSEPKAGNTDLDTICIEEIVSMTQTDSSTPECADDIMDYVFGPQEYTEEYTPLCNTSTEDVQT